MEPHLQMCLNGKCVPEHENAVDFSGDGFFRRSGSSSSIGGVDDEIIENYTEPKDRPRLVTAHGRFRCLYLHSISPFPVRTGLG